MKQNGPVQENLCFGSDDKDSSRDRKRAGEMLMAEGGCPKTVLAKRTLTAIVVVV